MPSFYWLPYRDAGWLTDAYSRANIARGDRMLPFLNGGSAAGSGVPAGTWDDVRENDSIFLPVHGHKYTTSKVSWSVGDQLVSWTAGTFADHLRLKLDQNHAASHHFHLLACFGANNITFFHQSFGFRLASEMKARGLRGDMTAYMGATHMQAVKGHEGQIGTSRLTAAPYFLMQKMRGKGGAPSHVTLLTRDAGKTWPIG